MGSGGSPTHMWASHPHSPGLRALLSRVPEALQTRLLLTMSFLANGGPSAYFQDLHGPPHSTPPGKCEPQIATAVSLPAAHLPLGMGLPALPFCQLRLPDTPAAHLSFPRVCLPACGMSERVKEGMGTLTSKPFRAHCLGHNRRDCMKP